MSYLAENLAMFMAEAVDRNGKKDSSLNMNHPSDMAKKYKDKKDQEMKDFDRNFCRRLTKFQLRNASPQDARRLITHKYMDNTMKNAEDFYNSSANGANCNIANMKAEEKKKKSHNESALFNDPIWDTLV